MATAGMRVALPALLFALPGWLPAAAYRENDRVGYSLAQKESDEGVAGADLEAELVGSEALDDYDLGEVDEGDKDDLDGSEAAREESTYTNQEEDSSALSQVDSEEREQGAMEDELASSLGDTVSNEKEAVDHVEDSSGRVATPATPPALLDKTGDRAGGAGRAGTDPNAETLMKALEVGGQAMRHADEKAKNLKALVHTWHEKNDELSSAADTVKIEMAGTQKVLESDDSRVQAKIKTPPAEALEALHKSAQDKALQPTQEGVSTNHKPVKTKEPDEVGTKREAGHAHAVQLHLSSSEKQKKKTELA